MHVYNKETAVPSRELRVQKAAHGQPQLAAAFEKLIHNAPLRRQLGAAGRAWATRNCWKESAEALFHPVAADAEP